MDLHPNTLLRNMHIPQSNGLSTLMKSSSLVTQEPHYAKSGKCSHMWKQLTLLQPALTTYNFLYCHTLMNEGGAPHVPFAEQRNFKLCVFRSEYTMCSNFPL